MSLHETLSLTDAFTNAKTPTPDYQLVERDKLPSMSPESDSSSESESESGVGKKRSREEEEQQQGDAPTGSGAQRGGKKRARKGPGGTGKPHKCQAPGCGKSYTRAEHLHRHELNRKRFPSHSCEPCSHVRR